MNGLIVYPLLLLIVLSAFVQLLTYDTIDVEYSGTLDEFDASGEQAINGTSQEFQQATEGAVFDINATTGIIALIIGLVAVGVIAGIKILGSGLSEFSVKLIYNATTYYGLWGIFSSLSYVAFSSIPYTVGLFLWLGLTLLYSLGFFQTLNGGGGGE